MIDIFINYLTSFSDYLVEITYSIIWWCIVKFSIAEQLLLYFSTSIGSEVKKDDNCIDNKLMMKLSAKESIYKNSENVVKNDLNVI